MVLRQAKLKTVQVLTVYLGNVAGFHLKPFRHVIFYILNSPFCKHLIIVLSSMMLDS